MNRVENERAVFFTFSRRKHHSLSPEMTSGNESKLIVLAHNSWHRNKSFLSPPSQTLTSNADSLPKDQFCCRCCCCHNVHTRVALRQKGKIKEKYASKKLFLSLGAVLASSECRLEQTERHHIVDAAVKGEKEKQF